MTELDLSSELVVISGAAGGLGRLVVVAWRFSGQTPSPWTSLTTWCRPLDTTATGARAMALDANPECVTFNFYSSMRPAPTK